MAIKYALNYSINFDLRKRRSKEIRFVIFHYTGMKNENDAINRLKNFNHKVSTHFFIKYNGKIICMVPEKYIAWHAGKSKWKNFSFLNKSSIGIEISNQGHSLRYSKFTNEQIKSIIKLSIYLKDKYKIKKSCFLGHSDIAPDRKVDPGENFPWEALSKKNIGIWTNLSKKKLSALRSKKLNKRDLNLFNKKLNKLGYMKSSSLIKKISIYQKKIYKVFQMRFRPELIDGKIDQECFLILKKLVNLR